MDALYDNIRRRVSYCCNMTVVSAFYIFSQFSALLFSSLVKRLLKMFKKGLLDANVFSYKVGTLVVFVVRIVIGKYNERDILPDSYIHYSLSMRTHTHTHTDIFKVFCAAVKECD